MGFFVIIGLFIILCAWWMDKSCIRRFIAGKINKKEKWETVPDERIEVYKTLSIFGIGMYYVFFAYARYIVFFVIGLGLIAFIRCLRYPDKVSCTNKLPKGEVHTVPVLFIMIAIGLAFPYIATVEFDRHSVILIAALSVVMFGIYFFRIFLFAKQKTWAVLNMLIPSTFFVVGCVIAINFSMGVTKLDSADTVVESIHIGMHTGGIEIPKEDAVAGKTSFTCSISGVEKGTAVHINAYQGCLGIRWFTVTEYHAADTEKK